jgi:hypothetical protein
MGDKIKKWHNPHRKQGEQRHFRKKQRFDKRKPPGYVPPSDATEIYDLTRIPNEG